MKTFVVMLLLTLFLTIPVMNAENCTFPGGSCLVPAWATCYQIVGSDCDTMYFNASNICEGRCLPANYTEYCWECITIIEDVLYVGKLYYACGLVKP